MVKKIQDLISEMDTCVLATARQGRPYCSLMAYASHRDGKEIYMVTGRDSTKFSNIMENPYVSLMIDTREKHGKGGRHETLALTVEGRCRPVKDNKERSMAIEELVKKNSHLRHLVESADSEVICVSISSCLLLEGLDRSYFEKIETQ